MILTRLQLQHFRNYTKLDLPLAPGSTLLYGANGAGKTNIVEAIFTLATTKSFRARTDRELIDRDFALDESPYPFARLQGDAVEPDGRSTRVEILLTGADGAANTSRNARKQFRLNGLPKRATDVVGQITAVLFSPADVEIVTGAPSGRRRYLDLMLCQVDPDYLRLLQSYGRIVQQRNGVLTRLSGRTAGTLLEVWDEKLVATGSEIILRRRRAMSKLATYAADLYEELSSGAERFAAAYTSTVAERESAEDAAAIAEAFTFALQTRASHGADARVTAIGPHRDDLALNIDDDALISYGSRGQQRTAALALRMAEARLIAERTGRQPILLLDEALSELDESRREALLVFARSHPQVVLTGTGVGTYPEGFIESATLVHIRAGEVADQPVSAGLS